MIKLFEMFAGYGGCSFAFKKAEIPFECIGYSDIDKYAIQCFNMNHPGTKNYGDCTKINPKDLPDFNLLTGGFPCQDVSLAGNRDLSRGRTLLFDEIIRVAAVKKPKYMILENVKGLLSANKGEFWKYVKMELCRIGYGITYKVLNSRDFGIPQNRERIWIICKLGGWKLGEMRWPKKESLELFVKDILEENVDKKYYLSEKAVIRLQTKNNDCSDGMANTLTASMYKTNWSTPIIGDFRFDEGFRQRKDGVAPCLAASNRENISNSVIIHNTQTRSPDRPSLIKECPCGSGKLYPKCCGVPAGSGHLSKGDGTTYCIDSGNTQAIEFQDQWRRLTPRECFRLMGFTKDEIKVDEISDSQCYKLAGNGWDINVVSKILLGIFKNTNGDDKDESNRRKV